jgi:hypothetical protein
LSSIFIVAHSCFNRRLFFITTPRRDSAAVVAVSETCRRRLPVCYSGSAADWIGIDSVAVGRRPMCSVPLRSDRYCLTPARPGSAKSSSSAQRSSFGPKPRERAEPSELPYAGRRVLKKLFGTLFLSYPARRFSSGPELWGHVTLPELSNAGRRMLEPTGHVSAPELP